MEGQQADGTDPGFAREGLSTTRDRRADYRVNNNINRRLNMTTLTPHERAEINKNIDQMIADVQAITANSEMTEDEMVKRTRPLLDLCWKELDKLRAAVRPVVQW